jgi:hypothetical protein
MLRDKSLEYKSVIIDNLTELWSMDLRDRYGPMTAVEWTKHAASTSDIMQLVRNWIDLAEVGPKLNVIFVFQETPETRDIRGRTGVIVSEVAFNKALQSHIPTLINFLGRLYIHTEQPPYRRVLDFRPIDTMHQAKLQVDRDDQYAKQIPFEVYDPSLASILDTIRGHKPRSVSCSWSLPRCKLSLALVTEKHAEAPPHDDRPLAQLPRRYCRSLTLLLGCTHMNIYLAANYERRLEIAEYAKLLREDGHIVTSRWLTGEGEQHPRSGVPSKTCMTWPSRMPDQLYYWRAVSRR